MILQEEFNNNGYENLLNSGNASEYGIHLEDIYDLEDAPRELLGLYISKQKDELFFLLDGSNNSINDICNSWDERIRIFTIANGRSKEVYKLKYNIVLLIVCSENEAERSSESNLFTTRKIVICGDISDKNKIIIDEIDAIELPFYMISTNDYSTNEALKAQLNQLLPNDENLLALMTKERKKEKRNNLTSTQVKTFNNDEYSLIKEWLKK